MEASTGQRAALVETERLSKAFGGVHAVEDFSFSLGAGTVTGLIGPNGAGKTTLFNLLAGALRPSAGRIRLDGERIEGLAPHRVFHKGLVRTFQIPRPFPELSVLDNLLVTPAGQQGERFWNNWFRRGQVRRQERRLRAQAMEVLELVTLASLASEPARNLSGGQRKLLDVARALMARPKVMLLDEPGAGVNRTLLGTIVERIGELNRRGMTFLIIEHNMDLVMSLCDPVLVMADGRFLMQGPARDVQRDPRVLDAYLGGAT